MGEDIHSKVIVYSKIEQKYIDGLSFTTYPEQSCFGPLFEGRNYDFYSLFGSQRGDLIELSDANYGIPDFAPATYKKFLEESGYYGFIWWKLPQFKKSIKKYIKLLKNPKKFLKLKYGDDDFNNDFDKTFNVKEYDMEMNCIYRWLLQMNKQIDEIEQTTKDGLDNFIDVKKTVFLFYFDC